MSTERKPQRPEGEPQMEKQNMPEPQEEFIGDEARPSVSKAELEGEAKPPKAAPPETSKKH